MKTLNRKQKAALRRTAEILIKGQTIGICTALWHSTEHISTDYLGLLGTQRDSSLEMIHPVLRMFNPYLDMNVPRGLYWWCRLTTGNDDYSIYNLNARLLAIAFMLTMPEDMIYVPRTKGKNLKSINRN